MTFSSAANWIAALLAGSMATAFAVLAVAAVGFSLLFGRVSYECAARVVLGCFILFGAGQIATALVGIVSSSDSPIAAAQIEPPTYVTGTPILGPGDPYAGAAAPHSKNGLEYLPD